MVAPRVESAGSGAAIAILDVDGTLVDTNYHHAIAWFRAFQRYDVTLPIWRIHRHIGMGGDQLVGALAGEEVEERCGDLIREAEGELYRRATTMTLRRCCSRFQSAIFCW